MKNFLKVFFLLVVFISSMCVSFANSFLTDYRAGYDAYTQKDYKKAVKIFENLLAQNYDDYNVYCLLGMSYGGLGQGKQAEAMFMAAIKKNPDNFPAYTFLGDMRRTQRRYPEAIGYYQKALKLSSMPAEGKEYYSNLINEVIEEQKEFDKTQANYKPDITVNLDMSIWELAYSKGDDSHWMVEYGLIGEDVINYKWTKLVTVNFFDKNIFKFDLNGYYNNFINSLKEHAKGINSNLKLEVLSKTDSEIYFVWSIAGRNEFEFCRIFMTPKGLYFGHYAEKKNSYTAAEKENILAILKSIKAPQK